MPEEAGGYWLCAIISIVTNISDGLQHLFPYCSRLKLGVNMWISECASLLADSRLVPD
jgi:hypothetical protein